MHEQIFDDHETWAQADEPRSAFIGYAEALGLDTDEFETCLDSDWAKLRVQAGNVVGALYGVPGAPVFLFNNGQGEQGSPTFEEFQTVIDSIINQ
jgi:predicted DsbA family dithiol-disulfide isomerase